MAEGTIDLLDRAVATLSEALGSPELPLSDRASLALRVLELTHKMPLVQLPAPAATQVAELQARSATVIRGDRPAHLPQPAPLAPLLIPQVYQIDQFLSPEEHQAALQVALTRADQFVGSKTTTNAADYRRSSILYATLYPDLYELLRQRILAIMPVVVEQLRVPRFTPGQVEMQLTAHNDGCFYKIHNDSGSPETITRVLTYVYYFYQEPKQFSGGELRLYETDLNGSMVTESDRSHIVEPLNNRIVFFDSRCKHEVLPVRCPSQQFADSRFTLNGWIRRLDAV
ncbi:MAG: hydroxylase [Oscillatoriales cyanobacterium]|nr:MAG: hydroxylase [Oscillatoriales cyanobacterium]